MSVPSTPGKQRPPHPHSEVCRGSGNWVAVSCACGPGELATGSRGAMTVMGRAGHLPQGQWPLGGPVSISGWTLVFPEAPRGALVGRGGPGCPSLLLAPRKSEGRGPRVPGTGLWCVLCPLPLSLVTGPEPPARGGRCGHTEGASQERVWPVSQRPGVVRDRAARPQPLLRQHHGQRPVGGGAAAKWVPVRLRLRLRALPACRVTQIDSAHSALGPSGRQADSHPFMSLHPHLGGAWQKPQEGSQVEWRRTAEGPRSGRRTGEGLPGELCCAARPRGLGAQGSPPRLGTLRTRRGEPGARPARPADAHCSGKGGKPCWRLGRSLGSVLLHVCREEGPQALLLRSPPSASTPCGATGLGLG